MMIMKCHGCAMSDIAIGEPCWYCGGLFVGDEENWMFQDNTVLDTQTDTWQLRSPSERRKLMRQTLGSRGHTAMRLDGEAAPRDCDPRISAKEADERERKAKVTRAVDHMVDKAGFTLDQTMAISALFTAMIESHEETWGKR